MTIIIQTSTPNIHLVLELNGRSSIQNGDINVLL